jgi:DNA-binding transcriptional ArsR family regulator
MTAREKPFTTRAVEVLLRYTRGGVGGCGRLAGQRGAGIIWRMTGIDCIAALKALGELNRLRIMRLLLKEQLGVNQISERLKLSQYNVSKHLRILKEAGLVEREKEGQQRLYAVVPRLKNQLAANRNVLELGCCTFRFDKLPK